jgi:hypothetical protein
MATYTKVHLSGGNGGQPIEIGSTDLSSPTLIHTTETSSIKIDEVWIYANNVSSSEVKLSILFGGNADITGGSADNLIEIPIAAEAGLVLVIPGLILSGNNSEGRTVRAVAATAGTVNITGYVNRIA